MLSHAMRRLAAVISLVLLLLTGYPAAATTIVSGRDASNDVKITAPKKSGPSKTMRKSIDIRTFKVTDHGRTRTIKIKVKRIPKGNFSGRDQLFYVTSYTKGGTEVAAVGFSHRPRKGGWAYSNVSGAWCDFSKIRPNKKTNVVTATVRSTCFPVPSAGRIQVNTMVGIYRSDAPTYAWDKARTRVSPGW